jgi:hypothetical protein
VEDEEPRHDRAIAPTREFFRTRSKNAAQYRTGGDEAAQTAADCAAEWLQQPLLD